MEYNEFLKLIFARYSGNVKLGLERMHDILSKMDNPEKKLKGIHIAGTNGKGSTSAISEAILLAHNHSVGMNTSPHLIDYTERFRINGENISVDDLMDLYDRHKSCFVEDDSSFFEITTSLAFKLFVEKKVESAVIEVGLGGRLDGTQPFNSSVCIITSISIDHPKSLGDKIEQIAFEKAGIIKENTPVVIGNLKNEALEVIKKTATEKNAPIYLINKDFFISNVSVGNEGTVFDYSFPKFNIDFKGLKLNLLGKHQAHNASLSITANALYLNKEGQKINEENVRIALSRVNWQGRMQVLSKNPFVIIDGAHNEEGVSSLVENVKELFPGKRYHFLVAILRDKKLDNMIREICTIAHDIYISKNHSDRAADIEEQVQVAIECKTPYYANDDILESLYKCLKTFQDDDDMLIITGSLYTIAEVLRVKDDIFKDS